MTSIETIQRLLEPLQQAVQNPPTPQRLAVMVQVLSEYDEAFITLASIQAVKTFKFWPSPAEFLELFEDKTMEAETAWNELLTHNNTAEGYWSPPKNMSGPTRMALRNIGGWDAVKACETEKVPILAKQFRDAYKSFAKREFVERLQLEPPPEIKSLVEGIGKKL